MTVEDPITKAVREGENRAEREWFREQGEPLPDRLRSESCLAGEHVYALQYHGCLLCGEVRQ